MSHPDRPDPPWSGWISTTGDALLILEAARQGLIPRVTRRLVDAERKMICSGSVFVFDEEESGIKRWTDGYFWSPSRILGNFLLYRETGARGGRKRKDKDQEVSPVEDMEPTQDVDPKPARSLVGSLSSHGHTSADSASHGPPFHFKPDGLMKKTFSLTINGVPQHLISYYKPSDVTNGRLRCPSTLPELASLDISPEYLDKTHFRVPPKVEMGTDGVPRYRGDADEEEIINKGGPPHADGVKSSKERRPPDLLSRPVHVNAKRPPSDDELEIEAPPDKRMRSAMRVEPLQASGSALVHYVPTHVHAPALAPPPSQHSQQSQYGHPSHTFYPYPFSNGHVVTHISHLNHGVHPLYSPYYPIFGWPHQQHALPSHSYPEPQPAPNATIQ